MVLTESPDAVGVRPHVKESNCSRSVSRCSFDSIIIGMVDTIPGSFGYTSSNISIEKAQNSTPSI